MTETGYKDNTWVDQFTMNCMASPLRYSASFPCTPQSGPKKDAGSG